MWLGSQDKSTNIYIVFIFDSFVDLTGPDMSIFAPHYKIHFPFTKEWSGNFNF